MSDTTFILNEEQVEAVTQAYGSTEPNLLMAYGYAFGRLDAYADGMRKPLVNQPGVGRSETTTACWFAHLYTTQTGTMQYGHPTAWENFVASNGERVSA